MSFQTSWQAARLRLLPDVAMRCRRVLELVGHHGGDIRGLTLTFQRDAGSSIEPEAEPEPELEPSPAQ